MQAQHTHRTRRSRAILATASAGAALVLSGCSEEAQRGYMPGYSDGPVTNQTDRITHLWTTSWATLLIVGLITWGLMLWCVVVYRKRKGDNTFPVQLRYHVPLEILYIVLPIFMIGTFFFYTNRDTTAIEDVSATPDVTIEVIGKQWAWDINYLDDDVYETSVHLRDVSAPGALAAAPTIYVPVGERVEFKLESRDVIHSFWVPAFLYKKDMIPSHTNRFQIIPEREGVYVGKCAELCGQDHSAMLFNVAVVTRAEYDAQMAALEAKGQTGQLGLDLNRRQSASGLSSEVDN